MKTSILVIYGDGINCERETARAFEMIAPPHSLSTVLVHVNDFLQNPKQLLEHSIFCLPGGFSFGDELRSGKILAEKMRSSMSQVFQNFIKKGGLALGVCNGFQVLIQLGVFSGFHENRTVTLATNDHGKFLDRWVELKVTSAAQKSPWFKGMSGSLFMPIRHKEGRILIQDERAAAQLAIPLQYLEAVNGAYQRAAALLDPSGQILGLMPHPEAALHDFLNPLLQSEAVKAENATRVRQIFINALEHVKGNPIL